MAPRETENIAYAKFWGNKQRALWYVMSCYLHFWHLLGDEMVQSFNYAHKVEQLNITQRQGIIKVIPKKRKNRLYLEHWRPLTLLNVD